MEHAVVDIDGELDFTSTADVVSTFSELPHRVVSIDVSSLEFVDVAGVRALRRVVRETGERWGSEPALVGARSTLTRTMSIVDEKIPAHAARLG
jgi:anti-anti-sigma regulatory factor